MPRYIEEKELMEWVQNWFEKNRYYHPYSKSNDIPITELYDILEQMHTADVIEVVRCKDCKYAHNISFKNGVKCLSCTYQNAHGMLVENHGFCYWGERRDDETY